MVAVAGLMPAVVYKLDGTPLVPGDGVEIPGSLAGRAVLITGSSKGIGFYAARDFCSLGAHVIVTGRRQKANEAAATQAAAAGGKATPMAVDMADFASVRRFAGAVRRDFASLHVAVLNAGIAYGPKQPKNTTAPSGHDLAYATNHLGHFLLYKLLLRDRLSPGGAVVVVGSGSMWSAADYGAMMPQRRPLYESKLKHRRFQAYATSKLANRCFAQTVRRRLAEKGISVNLYNPGVTGTEMLGARSEKCLKYHFWDWCGPPDVAGTLLMQSAFVDERRAGGPPEVLQAYWWPRFIFQRYAPKSALESRRALGHWAGFPGKIQRLLRWGALHWAGFPGKIQRLLRWGALHATVAPECPVDVQERLWTWSTNATGAPP